MNERDYIQPVFQKDKQYTECEDCNGKGYFYELEIDGSTTTERCDRCNGTGELEIED